MKKITIDPATARWYLRILVIRHLAALGGLTGFLLLVSGTGDGVRRLGAVAFVGGLLLFALSVSVFLIPLTLQLVPQGIRSSTEILAALNRLTGHTVLQDTLAIVGQSLLTPGRVRLAVIIEAGLLLAIPLVAIASH